MDEDKEKAEQLAAARKRFEQLKKKKGKKGPATAAKEEPTEEKAAESSQAEASEQADTPVPSSPKPDQSARVAELEEHLAALRTENDALKAESEGLKSETEGLKGTVAELTGKTDELGAVVLERDELQDEVEGLKYDLETTRAQLSKVKEELSSLKAAALVPETKPTEDTSQVETLLKDLAAARDREAFITAELATAKARISSLQAELAGVKATQDLFPQSPPSVKSPPTSRQLDVRNLDDESDIARLEHEERERLRQRVKTLEAQSGRDGRARESVELRRKERRKAIERELEKWKGWKIDLMAAGGGRGVGPVFEV